MRRKLRTLRKARKLTIKQVADAIGVTPRMYVYIEQGKRNPSLAVANKLEDIFSIPQRELLVLDSEDKHSRKERGRK